jgi:hypothetical protein
MHMPELKLTQAEYDALPPAAALTALDLKIKPLGLRFKARDGHVCELVKGSDMLAHQWGAGLSVPERGLVHYRPVIVEVSAGKPEEFRQLFHELWIASADQPGYDKRKWTRLSELLLDRGIQV